MEQLNTEIIPHSDYFIPFEDMHPKYGRAEFEFCTVFKRGKITDLYITPRQQELETIFHYHAEEPYQGTISFTGYDHLPNPYIWYSYYCRLHKAQCLRLYVPATSKYLWISPLSTLSIGFLKTKLTKLNDIIYIPKPKDETNIIKP